MHEWIDVKERLPDFKMPVIWWHKKDQWIGDHEKVRHVVGYLDKYKNELLIRYFCYDNHPQYEVNEFSHWTPFPEGPK